MPNNTNDTQGTKRCVIYCRKSSSDGLDRDYTSIDCQTDTCKAFIERHKNDGWRFTGAVYADGGFSGGTTNRPDFQRMMDSVRAGEIDVIVIYKLDRISRNKRDFWNLAHELKQYPSRDRIGRSSCRCVRRQNYRRYLQLGRAYTCG